MIANDHLDCCYKVLRKDFFRCKISVEFVDEQHFLNSFEMAILLDNGMSFQRSKSLFPCGTFTLAKEEEINCFMKVFYSYPIMQGNSVHPIKPIKPFTYVNEKKNIKYRPVNQTAVYFKCVVIAIERT